jgi:KDO2-lipid IV(A) lauroyltransferase
MAELLMRLAARLPPFAQYLAGGLLGWTMYLASPRYRRHFLENLAAAGYGRDRKTRRRAIAEAGRMLTELPAIWLRPRAESLARIRAIRGREIAQAAHDAGKALVFLTPHYGCFEITAQLAADNVPITVLYRPPKLAFLQALIDRGRAQHNVKLAPANVAGVRELMGAMRRGEALGILPDQVPGEGEGVWAEFFGKPAYTMTLAMKLASRPNAVALLAFCRRLPWGAGFDVLLRPLPEALPDESPERRLNRAVEELVRECPEQYLWGYNRYKKPRGASDPQSGATG